MAQIDFDDWIKTFTPKPIKYFAIFDPNDGLVTGVYPETVLTEKKFAVEIDNETAILIQEGKLQLSSCFVNLDSGNFEIAEIKVLNKIDDVLHRIIDKKWSLSEDNEDLYVTYDSKKSTIKFELSSKYNGTRKSKTSTKRKIHWDGSTTITFLITEYNDPNELLDVVKFTINDLIKKSKSVKIKTKLPKKFSVYTKRIFPNYVFEEK